MTRPLIGVSTYQERAQMGVWDVDAVFLPLTYLRPIRLAGAAIVELSPQDPADALDILARLDGLAISGGYDVDPALYGADAHPHTDAPRPERDAWEIALLKAADELDLPTLGVCRGAQVLNVARGGTLHQHLPDLVGSTRHQGAHGVFARLPVTVEPTSLLGSLHPHAREVPVYHHQAIDSLGEGLVVSARSDDGVIEAVEDPSRSFLVATQWHPEQDADELGIYQGFVAAAQRRRSSRG